MSEKPTDVVFGTAQPEEIFGLSGLEMLQKMMARQLPAPTIGRTMNFWMESVSRGRAVFVGEPNDQLLNPLGGVHGGWVLTLVDSAAGCAAHSTLPAGVGYATLETKANMTRPINPDTGAVRAEGLVVAEGRQVITAEVKVRDMRDRILAHGTSTLLILRPSKGTVE
jgi:uncharacterized protein (TIGR00369 family)